MSLTIESFDIRSIEFWLALCDGDYLSCGQDQPIYRGKYAPVAYEQQFQLGSGRNAHPELVLRSEARRRIVFLETKTGELDESNYGLFSRWLDQLHRYLSITTDDLTGWFGLKAPVEFDCVYNGHTGNINSLMNFLHKESTLPAIEMNVRFVALRGGEFGDKELDSWFSSGVDVNWDNVPRTLRVNQKIRDRDLAAQLARLVVVRHQRHAPGDTFSLSEICGEVFSRWELYGGQVKDELERRVKGMLTLLSTRIDPMPDIFLFDAANETITVSKHFYRLQSKHRPGFIRKMRRGLQEFVEEVGKGSGWRIRLGKRPRKLPTLDKAELVEP